MIESRKASSRGAKLDIARADLSWRFWSIEEFAKLPCEVRADDPGRKGMAF